MPIGFIHYEGTISLQFCSAHSALFSVAESRILIFGYLTIYLHKKMIFITRRFIAEDHNRKGDREAVNEPLMSIIMGDWLGVRDKQRRLPLSRRLPRSSSSSLNWKVDLPFYEEYHGCGAVIMGRLDSSMLKWLT